MKSLKEIEEIRTKTLNDVLLRENKDGVRVVVGMATCGIAAGANTVMDAINDEVKKRKLKNVTVTMTGCVGLCRLEPMVDLIDAKGVKTTYTNLTVEKARKIFDNQDVAQSSDVVDSSTFFLKQQRVALRNCGIINPEKIDEYLAQGGYKALEKALFNMSSQNVIEEIKKSGLRGRGGGGFPTDLKWEFAAKQPEGQKYVCCNADEGDPGAFMDRSVLEGDPHSILEAMALAGYAIGAENGYIYVRAEYPIAVRRLELAISQAKEYGLLGNNIFGKGFNFDIEVRLGAGAFVCGEETALMTSIEGKRGEPRTRPPFPVVKGLWKKPTILNNVETYANIPEIIVKGGEWFASIGTEKSKGTKVFAVGGNINNTGLVEVPMGTTLREVIYEIGGGIPDNKKFKAAQTGGPSGGCIPASHIDTPIDYDSLIQLGSMMGSGGLIIMDEDTCMVDIAKFFLQFTVDESCGKCTPCRLGIRRMLDILEKITTGKANLSDIDELETLAENIKVTSLCGLGQTAPNPVLSTLKCFRDEYLAHIQDKKCPASNCRELLNYKVIAEKCKKCGICAKNCSVNAITGDMHTQYEINTDECIKCNVCFEKCPFDAISR